jgi:hypothetical protein
MIDPMIIEVNKESKEWLISSMEKAYPEDTLRLEQLKNDDYSV